MPTVDELKARVGHEIGVSDWVMVDQEMIDRFADLTGDHQFIHVDPGMAKLTPLGGTIAHGFLTLSLMPLLQSRTEGLIPSGIRMGLNYGCDRLRFLTPVRSGSRIRGRFKLLALDEKQPGELQQRFEFTVEIEDGDKPALVAEWLVLFFV